MLSRLRWVVRNRAWTHYDLVRYVRYAVFRVRHPSVVCEGMVFLGRDVRVTVRRGYGRLVLGALSHIGDGCRLRVHEGTVRLGPKVVLGSDVTVTGYLDIEIGAATIVADLVYVTDFDHLTSAPDVPIKDQGIVKAPVRIGPGCWLGVKSSVCAAPGSVRAACWQPTPLPAGTTRRARSSPACPGGWCVGCLTRPDRPRVRWVGRSRRDAGSERSLRGRTSRVAMRPGQRDVVAGKRPCGVTDQQAAKSPGDGQRAPAAASGADQDTDRETTDPEATDDGMSKRWEARIAEIARRADERAGEPSDKARANQAKKDARARKRAERAERRQAEKVDKAKQADKAESAERVEQAERAERRQAEKPDKQGDKPAKGKGAKPDQGLGGQVSAGVSAVRNRVASIVWLIAVLCAVILAVGALLAALSDNINEGNPIVEFVNDTARTLDGPFGNIITFDGKDDRTKEVLVNWGLAALAYLVVGRILDRLIRA